MREKFRVMREKFEAEKADFDSQVNRVTKEMEARDETLSAEKTRLEEFDKRCQDLKEKLEHKLVETSRQMEENNLFSSQLVDKEQVIFCLLSKHQCFTRPGQSYVLVSWFLYSCPI